MMTVPNFLGSAIPMSHQREDVIRLEPFSRINVWNGLGTGKTLTVGWWLYSQWRRGVVDEVVLVAPGMCAADWRESLRSAFPGGLVEFVDCRPPGQGVVVEALSDHRRPLQHALQVYCTTYGGMRSIFAGDGDAMLAGARGRRVALICDEAQSAALKGTMQGIACRTIAAACRAVASVTATPVGREEQLRLWGMASLVRPDVLLRLPVGEVRGKPVGKPGSYEAFAYRFAHMHDPKEGKDSRGGRRMMFNIHRAYPVAVHSELIQQEVLSPMVPYTVRRRKEDCLNLPEKVRMMRLFRLSPSAARMMDGLVDDDRAILDDGRAVVPANILEEKLRCLELCGGWLTGEPVHDGKLFLLRDVLAEISENVGLSAPVLVWASRSREVVAAALVAAATSPADAQKLASAAYPSGTSSPVRSLYNQVVEIARIGGVGIIHGPTPDKDRDEVQRAWKSGTIRTVVAHPGVAGAGLNWQHVRATVYYSPPLGTIARQQSEDRVHRKGLQHLALYYDLVVEDGPDVEVTRAHAEQRDAAEALLSWLSRRA